MRTYTRKRPEYQAIEGVTALCRLCLGSSEVTVPIFGDDADQLCATLSLRITMCVGLEMTRDEYLPSAIFLGCYKELEQYYTFRKKCEVTYQKLKAHVMAMKERQSNLMLKKEQDMEQVTPVESDDTQHLVLTFDEYQRLQLVNLVNSNSVQLGTAENLFTPTVQEAPNETTTLQSNQEIVTESIQDEIISPSEIHASNADLSLIMSTMLVELGVLRQEDDRLVLVDEELKTVELEGADNTKIVLQLVEEDKEENTNAVQMENKPPLEDSTLTLIKSEVKKEPDSKVNGKRDTTCPVCLKQFASRSVLRRHALVHSGARPHACPACPRRFAQRAVLARHALVHAEKRPFACPKCPKSFTQKGALELHAHSHAPPHQRALRLHSCAACDKVFLYASGLSRHMATHSGRRHACGACGRAFADASALRRHERAHHAAQQPTPARDEISVTRANYS